MSQQISRPTDAQIASQIQELIGSPPPVGRGRFTPELGKWLGRASAVLNVYRGLVPAAVTAGTLDAGSGAFREQGVNKICIELHAALAEIEMHWLASPVDGAAFQPGQTLDVYKRLAQTLDRAQGYVLIVDPYLDEIIVTDYLRGLRNQRVLVDLLTSDKSSKCLSRLVPAAKRLVADHGTLLTIRISPELHDRVIFLDNLDECTVMGSSIKDAATRSPTYLTTLDAEIGADKRVVYNAIWARATPIDLATA